MHDTHVSPSSRQWCGLPWMASACSALVVALAMSVGGPVGAQGLSVKGGEAGSAGLGSGGAGVGTRSSGGSLYGLSSPGGPSLGISSPDVAPNGSANARADQASAPSSSGEAAQGRAEAPGKRAASKAKP